MAWRCASLQLMHHAECYGATGPKNVRTRLSLDATTMRRYTRPHLGASRDGHNGADVVESKERPFQHLGSGAHTDGSTHVSFSQAIQPYHCADAASAYLHAAERTANHDLNPRDAQRVQQHLVQAHGVADGDMREVGPVRWVTSTNLRTIRPSLIRPWRARPHMTSSRGEAYACRWPGSPKPASWSRRASRARWRRQ